MLGTVGMVFSAENILEGVFTIILFGADSQAIWLELVGWLLIFVVLAWRTSEEAEDNEYENDT